jgi:apolipoprotein N-acyltransferase
MNLDVISGVLQNLNTWLVMLAAGVFVWILRQVLPMVIENSKLWKIVLKVLPLFAGAGLACLPGLRPISDNMMQSAAIGLIGGSFATTVYELLREVLPGKIREMLGSPSSRLPKGSEPKVDE